MKYCSAIKDSLCLSAKNGRPHTSGRCVRFLDYHWMIDFLIGSWRLVLTKYGICELEKYSYHAGYLHSLVSIYCALKETMNS